MSFIQQYDRWYCYSCQRYGGAPQQRQPAAGAQRRAAEPRRGAAGAQVGRTRAGLSRNFQCPGCGKTAEIKTDKRPLKLKCARCGTMSMLRK